MAWIVVNSDNVHQSFAEASGNEAAIRADYGRASFDTRNHVFLGRTITLPKGFRLNPFMIFNSGTPFNVTVPLDLLGTSVLNDRPALVSSATCPMAQAVGTNIPCTQLGTFNSVPASGQQVIPINDHVGPSQFTFNLRLSKTFGFGTKNEGTASGLGGQSGGPGGFGRVLGGGRGGRGGSGNGPFGGPAASGQQYSLTFSVNARNLFNIVNPSTPTGNLGSERFDTSNALAGGAFGNASAVRVIQLQAQFNF